jgi:hypothetical protein
MEAYLLTYFSDDTHSLHLALSTDGYAFTAVNDGNPVVLGDTIASQKGIRDPHITRGPDGAFYLAMTDLQLYDWGNNRGFVLMKSFDLISWTHSNFLFDEGFEGFDNIGCAWAPQTIYNPEEGKMMIYFTMRIGHGLTKLYYAYTDDDFTKLVTKPTRLYDYPDSTVQVLDADIVPMPDGRYCMTYVAQERPGGIKVTYSDFINRGYQYETEMIDSEPGDCEAPNIWKRVGSDSWVLMYDVFSVNPHNFGFEETSDFKDFKNLGHFNEGVMKTTNFNSPKHGSVIQLTRFEADKLANYWGSDLNFED